MQKNRGGNNFGKHCSSSFFSVFVVPGQAVPMPSQSAFSCPILSPQTKTGTEEVKRISHTQSGYFGCLPRNSVMGIPGHRHCCPLAFPLVSAAPSARQCHRLDWEAESRMGKLLQESANEPYCSPGPELANHWELG